MTAKKWLISSASFLMIAFVLCSLITYYVDPFFQYRVTDNRYFINERFCAPGLIKNYDYDTIIIGSSMTQNFDMDYFREKLDCQPLHIGIGGMQDEDLLKYVLLANDIGKAKDYYLCVDIHDFSRESESNVVDYLMKSDIISHAQYALSYESLFRFIPIDIACGILTETGYPLPKAFSSKSSIDSFGYWGDEYEFGEKIVLDSYGGGVTVTDVDLNNLYERMINSIDDFFSQLDFDSTERYHFFFPPYSSLYWYNARKEGYMDIFFDAKEYFIEKAIEYGASVYDFQSADFTTDLNNYRDITHYKPEFNDWMTDCFSDGSNRVTDKTYYQYRIDAENLLDQFEAKYSIFVK